eukprot:3593222-Rhodomonas_salina.1
MVFSWHSLRCVLGLLNAGSFDFSTHFAPDMRSRVADAALCVRCVCAKQVIAQVVMELNAAAADEIRTLIREDKMDE